MHGRFVSRSCVVVVVIVVFMRLCLRLCLRLCVLHTNRDAAPERSSQHDGRVSVWRPDSTPPVSVCPCVLVDLCGCFDVGARGRTCVFLSLSLSTHTQKREGSDHEEGFRLVHGQPVRKHESLHHNRRARWLVVVLQRQHQAIGTRLRRMHRVRSRSSACAHMRSLCGE